MYESFYGLRERPFNLVPDPRFLFLSKQHNEALAHLQYGLTGRPGVTVLIGEAGTGKSTLVRKALDASLADSAQNRIIQLSNPTLTRAEFYEYLARGFGFTQDSHMSKAGFLFELEHVLTETGDGTVALIVDEAQSLPHDLLEEIRLLTNLQSPTGKALTMILVGQPELAARLNESRLRQLKQRVALRCELAPFQLQETMAYIARRVWVAGGKPEKLFTKAAVQLVHERARGIPRTISVICDNALVSGFASNMQPVGRAIIEEVCRDFELGAQRAISPEMDTVTPPATAAPVVSPEPAASEGEAASVGNISEPPAPVHRGIFSDPTPPVVEPVEPTAPLDIVEQVEPAQPVAVADDGSMFSRFSNKKRFSIFRGN